MSNVLTLGKLHELLLIELKANPTAYIMFDFCSIAPLAIKPNPYVPNHCTIEYFDTNECDANWDVRPLAADFIKELEAITNGTHLPKDHNGESRFLFNDSLVFVGSKFAGGSLTAVVGIGSAKDTIYLLTELKK